MALADLITFGFSGSPATIPILGFAVDELPEPDVQIFTLAHSPAEVVRQLLIDLGCCVTPSADQAPWSAYATAEPDAPDECVTVYDTAGRDGGRDFTGNRKEHHGVQVRVRAGEHRDGVAKAREIALALDACKLENVGVEAARYLVHAVTRTGTVISLGRDRSSDRRLWTLNAVVSIRQLS